MSNVINHLYEFGRFRLDTAEHVFLRQGSPVRLTPKAFDTLVALVERRGHLVGKNELMRAVWPSSFVEEGNLCVIISSLRKELGHDQDYIETVSKHGYRFVAEVSEVQEPSFQRRLLETPEVKFRTIEQEKVSDAPSPRDVADTGTSTSIPIWKPAYVALIILLSAVGIMWVAWHSSRKETLVAATKNPPIRSLAVLPFETVGHQDTYGYLGAGIADALTTNFGDTGKILVRPAWAMQKYTNSPQDPRTIGQELAVDAVLDGRIQREGERVRLTAQLIRVADGVQLWAGTFDEKFTNIFAVEDSVSAQVAKSISVQLTGEQKKRLTQRSTENPEAYQAYLKGRHFWNERTGEGIEKGLHYFQHAINLDSSYSQAYVGVADSYAMLGLYTVIPPNEAFPEAKAAALKALSIDDDLAEAHATLGFIHFYYDWDRAAAESEFKRALQENPNYAMAHSWHAFSLAVTGRLPDAIAEAKLAEQEDPFSPIISTNAAWVFHLAGQYDLAIEASNKALDLDPNFPRAHYRLGNIYEQKGSYDLAIAEYQKALPNSGGDTYYQAALGHAYALAGRNREAREVLDHLKDLSKHRYVAPYAIALIYVGLGDKERAFEWLGKAIADRSTSLAYVKVDPTLHDLRSDPRFAAILRNADIVVPHTF
jgi:DNA-binding winged helix-turn-helix (wHTH) protein/TolB-like protein/Flp pilus assembly protein TadD